jgi:hypothetical protein
MKTEMNDTEYLQQVRDGLIKLDNLCPECGKPVKQAGMRWSGRTRKQSWACRSKTGCGRVTFIPVHAWQNSLFGARAGGSGAAPGPAHEPAQEPARNQLTKKKKT